MSLSLARRRFIGILCVAAAVCGGAVFAGPPASAAPTPPNRLTLAAATQSFTSSTGTAVRLALGTGTGAMTVTLSTPGQPESHTWTFPFPDSSEISYDPATGKGALAASIAPYGNVALGLTAIGKPSVVGCGAARSDVQPVTISGTLSFASQSSWGKVGSATKQTFTGNSTLVTADPADKLCGSSLPPCVVTSVWEAHNIASDLRGFTQFIGTSTVAGSTTTSTLAAKRLTYLAAPNGATRTDLSANPVANPTFGYADPHVTVAVGSGSPHVTGTARMVGNSENAMPPLNCGDGQHRTARTEWLSTFTNGPAPLVVHEQIEGNYTLTNVAGESNRGNATIDRTLTTSA
jgi:hypothetical protein